MATAVPSLLAFLLAWTLLLARAAPLPPSPSPTPSCTDELVLFSPCLSYVSSPPNNLADAASANCCDAFSSAFSSGMAVCFCYLFREPPILGFPLNSTRLLSLSSVCPPTNGSSAMVPALNVLCSESPALPPLDKAATLGFTSPTTGSRNPASPSVRMPPKSDQRSPGKGAGASGSPGTAYSFPLLNKPFQSSSETEQICRSRSWLLASILTFVPLLTSL